MSPFSAYYVSLALITTILLFILFLFNIYCILILYALVDIDFKILFYFLFD